MKLPFSFAEKLHLLSKGEKLPASQLKGEVVERFIADGILQKHFSGRQKAHILLANPQVLPQYLKNHFGINDLETFILQYQRKDLTRAEAVNISADSKLKSIRSFKGFLINCYQPVAATLMSKSVTLQPQEGSFTFIYDYENFSIDQSLTVVGIENPTNFRHIQYQKHLFQNITPLFVSRYPQSKDLRTWLQSIPNSYLHFGDFDFAGISIYLNEFERYVEGRSSFFIPENIESSIKKNGSRKLYDKHLYLLPTLSTLKNSSLRRLVDLINLHKKSLEQEALIVNPAVKSKE